MRFLLLIACWFACRQAWSQTDFIERSSDFQLYHMYKDDNFIGGGVTFFDFNKDGLDDLSFASGQGDLLQFYISTGEGFINAENLGLAESRESKQLLWIDFDNDLDYDLFITNYEGPVRLWENKGDLQFENVTYQSGLPTFDMPVFGATWGDFDRDGFLDLFIPNYSNPAYDDNQKRNYLFRNMGDGTFQEIADRQNVLLFGQFNHYFSAAFLDLNNSGWPELFIIQDFGNNDGVTGNILFWNDQGQLRHADDCGSLEDIRMDAMTIASSDFNRNGNLDIYITNTHFSHSRFHVNLGELTFQDQVENAGITFNDEGFGWGAQFFDYDNDGWEDLAVVGDNATTNGQPQIDRLYKNQRDGSFLTLDESRIDFSDSTRSIGVAYGDFNRDGKIDFSIATTKTDSVQFFENTSSNDHHFISIKLKGTLSNSDGIGSWIEVYQNGQKQVRYTTTGIGFLSQNSSRSFFGLGANAQIDSILVRWPSGWVDIYDEINADQFVEITEGETADFRFDLTYSGEDLDNEITEVLISAPDFEKFKWNNDATAQSITAQQSGIYVCSVVDENGLKGLSNKLFIRQIIEEETDPEILSSRNYVPTEKLVIYPNPSNGVFFINDQNFLEVDVYNSSGKHVMGSKENIIDLSHQPIGIYLILIKNKEGHIKWARLIKK